MKGRWLLPGLFGLGVSCGGAKQEPARQQQAAREEPAVAALPPLVKVAAPPELFAVARVPNAAKTADTGIAWSGLPLNWRSLLNRAVPGLERAAALSAPVDFAAMLDPASVEEPRVEWAFSFGAASTEAAVAFLRAQGATVTSEAGGAYRARVGTGLSCAIVRALGVAPARVVCSDKAMNADALAPYMSCGMPTESFGNNELHAHVTAEPFRRRYGSQVTLIRTVGVPFLLRELSLDHPKFDRALRDVLYGLADEVIALAYDLDRLDLDATLAAGGNAVDVTTTLSMSGQRSWWAQSAAHVAGTGGPAPDAFWKLPLDSTSASYSSFGDAERYRGIAASLRELADGWLDYHKLSERRRMPVVEAIEQFITTGASTANAALPDGGLAPLPEKGRAASADSVRAAVGQHLFVLDRGGDRLTKLASALIKALGERSLREHLLQSKVVPAGGFPVGRERAPKFGKGLPPQTKVYELSIPAAALTAATSIRKPGKGKEGAGAEKAGEALSIVLVAMPDGPLTWFALGTDEKALEGRLAEVKAGTSATLAKREGLGALKTEMALSAGFSSLAALVGDMRSSLDKAAPNMKSLALLPHRGETPILFRAVADATGPKLTASGRVPRELIEDLVAMAASGAAGMAHK